MSVNFRSSASLPRLMYRRNSKNLPIPGTLSRRSSVPSTSWSIIKTVINGASPVPRQRFPGNKRYFVLLDASGAIIPSSFMASTQVPNSPCLEVFANGVITVTDDNATNSGGVIEDFEDIQDIPVIMSSNYLQNGYKYSFKSKK